MRTLLSTALFAAAFLSSLYAREKPPSTFAEYAVLPDLSVDETYTVELLIDRAAFKFDPNYWDTAQDLGRARSSPGYQPAIPRKHIPQAALELAKFTWLNFQRSERPVRDITALRYLPELTGLILQKNEITDISPIRHCNKIQSLSLADNPVRDLSPLSACPQIEELDISDCPLLSDLEVLRLLPRLKELTISAEQFPLLKKLNELPALQILDFDNGDPFVSFEDLPAMPELRTLRGAKVNSLRGVERFPKLEHLINLSGDFDSLEPLRGATCLTHANMWGTRVANFEPLSKLPALRDLWVETSITQVDLTPLAALPKLHDVTVTTDGKEHPALANLRASITSWDTEFLSENPRHVPSLKLEVVDQKTFDRYDTKESFGITAADTNKQLLDSERGWLEDKIEAAFTPTLKLGEDFDIPFQWAGARSRTVVLKTDKALKSFPKLVLALQKVICHSRRDWIIYFQSLDEDFIVWVHADKIVVTAEYADAVRRLIDGR